LVTKLGWTLLLGSPRDFTWSPKGLHKGLVGNSPIYFGTDGLKTLLKIGKKIVADTSSY